MTFWLCPWAVSTTHHIDIGLDEGLHASEVFDARRRPDPQPAALILAGVRELVQLVDVAHGDQPGQAVVAIDQQELLDLGLVEDLLGLIERGVSGRGDQVVSGSSPRRSARLSSS